MPARVHALLVVRPDARDSADIHLRRTLAALAAQKRPVDALTIVLCGDDADVRAIAAASGAEGVIEADRGTRYAEALQLASRRIDGDAVWLLAQDTAPEPDALAHLAGALETAPSVAFAVPKLVRWDDPHRIVSLGVTMTRGGATVGLAGGELDQGQHDGRQDVLGADVRALLVRADRWTQLAGLDPALAGADEGLDLGIRARLAGDRVALAPRAIVAVAGDGVAGLPDDRSRASRTRARFAVRAAQLHRRLVYAPGPAVFLHWLTLVPLGIVRALFLLVTKHPSRVGPEIAAAVVAAVRLPSVARARAGIRRTRRAGWLQLAPLRITPRELRERHEIESGPEARHELGFFTGGGAWIVLAALVLGIAAFPALLAWPTLGGGALAPLRATVAQLWADAAPAGDRMLGWATDGPADPFSAVVATLGSLSPLAPSRAIVVLWIIALPLAALGGWFAATRVTDRPLPRAAVAIAWTLAPPLLAALTDGRPAAVIAHLLLPWLLFTGAAAHRSWTYAGLASVIGVALIACAPSLAPALLVLWTLQLVLVATTRGTGIGRVLWLVVPALAVFLPIALARIRDGQWWALVADPGVPVAGATGGDDPIARIALLAGFPTADPGGWGAWTGGATWWVPILVVPFVAAALAAPLVTRLIPAVVTLVIAAVGIGSALLIAGISVASTAALPSPLWPGTALSLGWAGLAGAAALTLDRLAPRPQGLIALVMLGALAVAAVPALTASARGASVLTNGPASTLPAYVAAEGRGGTGVATLVLTPLDSGAYVARVVWGGSQTLGGQSTLVSVRGDADAADDQLATVVADLVTGSAGDVVDRLGAHGVGFVLVEIPGTDAAAASGRSAASALDLRNSLENVGDTGKGILWRVTAEVDPRDPGAPGVGWIAMQGGAVLLALLLAVPTATTARAARRSPRVIGARR
ncbi:glycosyltransferase [Microbacterium telephonicum]|uniref:GT2 family glycosyltransferase n=1 Tax=Microbacterium telephonicum TaxID=1714841 RepID=A0A498BWK5_9MICO|nr:glycosyltransferase [Microbacterium telephonicum]RLK47742.1 GT2 family glycosyltransferase [Microbacterium telephonicum]